MLISLFLSLLAHELPLQTSPTDSPLAYSDPLRQLNSRVTTLPKAENWKLWTSKEFNLTEEETTVPKGTKIDNSGI